MPRSILLSKVYLASAIRRYTVAQKIDTLTILLQLVH